MENNNKDVSSLTEDMRATQVYSETSPLLPFEDSYGTLVGAPFAGTEFDNVWDGINRESHILNIENKPWKIILLSDARFLEYRW